MKEHRELQTLIDELERHITHQGKEVYRLREQNQELLEALTMILDSRPFVGMNPKATVGSPYAVEWNVHTIARAAIDYATGESNDPTTMPRLQQPSQN